MTRPSDPAFDIVNLEPVLSHLRPSPPPPPVIPPAPFAPLETQPTVLMARCVGAPHRQCQATTERGLRTGVPALIAHHADPTHTKIRLYVPRQLRVLPASQRALENAFMTYAAAARLDPRCRATVSSTWCEWLILTPVVEPFLRDVLALVEFDRVRLP